MTSLNQVLEYAIAHTDTTTAAPLPPRDPEDLAWLATALGTIGKGEEHPIDTLVNSLEANPKDVLSALIEYADDLDHGQRIVNRAAHLIVPFLADSDPLIRVHAAALVSATSLHNASATGQWCELGVLTTLLERIVEEDDPDACGKQVSAISALVNDMDDVHAALLDKGGMDVLQSVLASSAEPRVQSKVLFLVWKMLWQSKEPARDAMAASDDVWIPLLLTALASDDAPVQRKAAKVLTELVQHEGTNEALKEDCRQAVTAAIAASEEPEADFETLLSHL